MISHEVICRISHTATCCCTLADSDPSFFNTPELAPCISLTLEEAETWAVRKAWWKTKVTALLSGCTLTIFEQLCHRLLSKCSPCLRLKTQSADLILGDKPSDWVEAAIQTIVIRIIKGWVCFLSSLVSYFFPSPHLLLKLTFSHIAALSKCADTVNRASLHVLKKVLLHQR